MCNCDFWLALKFLILLFWTEIIKSVDTDCNSVIILFWGGSEYVCACECAHVCGGQKSTLVLFLSHHRC